MKILHVITSLHTGGAEKLMVDLLPRLKDKGVDVDLCVHDETNTNFKKELENNGISVFGLGESGNVYSPLKFLRLLPKLKNYDIIHSHNTASQFFVAVYSLFNRKKIFITTEHGGSNRRRNIKGFRIIDRWLYKRYNKVICIAEKTKDNLLNYLKDDSDRFIIINNGIDTTKFLNAEPTLELEQLAPGSKKIIMVAGFRWEKDHPTLIKALRLLPAKFHLFLVGDGVRKDELITLTKSEGLTERVHFMGIKNNVPSLLKSADYVIMSSHFEGLSLSSVEGMASGKPMIASDVDGLREVIPDKRLLFQHQNAKELADIIMDLDKNIDKYEEVSKHCIETSKKYDISYMVDEYIKIYD